jgi:hypothetical protein
MRHCSPFAALRAPQLVPTQDAAQPAVEKGSIRGGAVTAAALYSRVVLVAALILGSHAMHDSFAVIRRGAARIGPVTVTLLWCLSVIAELMVFFFVGRPCATVSRRVRWCFENTRHPRLLGRGSECVPGAGDPAGGTR